MSKFQEKNRWKDILQSKPVLILFGIVIVFFIWNVFNLMSRMQETIKNRKIEEDKIAELKQRESNLSANIANLKTEKGVEENIREKYGLVKEGEGVIIVVEDKDKNNAPPKEEPNKFISFLKNLFK
jgi:cell division protein FtsB